MDHWLANELPSYAASPDAGKLSKWKLKEIKQISKCRLKEIKQVTAVPSETVYCSRCRITLKLHMWPEIPADWR